HADESILEEMRATDQWSMYQAKSIKLAILEGNIEQATSDGKSVAAERTQKVASYQSEMKAIEEKGRELEESSESHMHHHVWFSRGVTAFQIAIAMGAIAVLARRPKLWIVSLVLGLAGGAGLVLGFL